MLLASACIMKDALCARKIKLLEGDSSLSASVDAKMQWRQQQF
jgi:hypothetical protein